MANTHTAHRRQPLELLPPTVTGRESPVHRPPQPWGSASQKATRRVAVITPYAVAAAIVWLTVGLCGQAYAASHRAAPSALRSAVRLTIARSLNAHRTPSIRVMRVKTLAGWAFGQAIVTASARTEGIGVPLTFIAREGRGRHWEIGLQGTSRFRSLLRLSPRALIPTSIYEISTSSTGDSQAGGAGGGGPAFSLPWATGQTWAMWQGPHNTNGVPAKPWTSLDFSGGDGIVRAAADGVVYRPCGNLVIVDHGGGWETGYYHLANISVGQGQVVSRGTPLGHIGTGTGCGGHATGDHVHFSIYHFPSTVGNHTAAVWHLPADDLGAIGEVIGGWLIQDGKVASSGCLQRISDGGRQCAPSARIFNSGISGNGKAVGAPPTTNPGSTPVSSPPATTTPAPAGTFLHHVYHTCANGACGLKERTSPSLTASVTVTLVDGDQVNIVCQTRGDDVSGRDGSASNVWDRLDSGAYVADYYVDTPGTNGGFSPPIPQCPASTPTSQPTPQPTPAPVAPNRQAISSYDRMQAGAPHNGTFANAWQQFTAQSNTITTLGVAVGKSGYAGGLTVTISLCTNQPDANGNCNVIGQTAPAVVNYGNSQGDIGDVAATPGATYWIVYFAPQPLGNGWVTYWWAGGSTITTSDQMQAVVRGYNR
jgi:LasA protease